jgi:hypothetical protein
MLTPPSSTDFMFNIVGDANNGERRLTFDTLNNPNVMRTVPVNAGGANSCIRLTALVVVSSYLLQQLLWF